MDQRSKYEAIGKFIYGFERLQLLIDHLLRAMNIDLIGGTVLHEKLTGLEDALAQVELPAPMHGAIGAFLRHMRSMEAMNITLAAFATMTEEEALGYAEQAAAGDGLAEAVRTSLNLAVPAGTSSGA